MDGLLPQGAVIQRGATGPGCGGGGLVRGEQAGQGVLVLDEGSWGEGQQLLAIQAVCYPPRSEGKCVRLLESQPSVTQPPMVKCVRLLVSLSSVTRPPPIVKCVKLLE